ncbi:MAG: SpoIIE family protein phosphatase [Gammaproteobacteria bacterium]
MPDVAGLVRANRGLRATMESIGRGIAAHLGADRWSIMLLTDRGDVRIHSARGIPSDLMRSLRVRVGDGIAGGVAASGQGCLVKRQGSPSTRLVPYRGSSAICVPIRLGANVLGVVNLTDKTGDGGEPVDFSEADYATAELFSSHAAVSIDAVRNVCHGLDLKPHVGDARPHIDNVQVAGFQVLMRVTARMAANSGLDDILNEILRGTIDVLESARGSLMLMDEEGRTLRIAAGVGLSRRVMESAPLPLGEGVAGKVASTGVPLLLLERETKPSDGAADRSEGRDYRTPSAMSLPLVRDGEVLGVLNVNDRHDELDYSEADFEVAKVLAAQAALAVATARLMAESVQAARTREALEVARGIQEHFMPPDLGMGAVSVSGLSMACDEIGGDYIDFFPEVDSSGARTGAVYLVCGDVSGHGVGAALLMSMARASLRALLPTASLPDVVARLNRLVEADTPPEQYLTLFVGRLDPLEMRLDYVSAGHEPTLLRHADGAILMTRTTGMPLGMFDFADYSQETLALRPNDLIVLCTDGLSEAEAASGERFGRARLEQWLVGNGDDEPGAVTRGLHGAVSDFCHPVRLADDFSLVVARLNAC